MSPRTLAACASKMYGILAWGKTGVLIRDMLLENGVERDWKKGKMTAANRIVIREPTVLDASLVVIVKMKTKAKKKERKIERKESPKRVSHIYNKVSLPRRSDQSPIFPYTNPWFVMVLEDFTKYEFV